MPSPRYPSELANDVMVMKANIAEPAPVRLLKPKNKAVVSKTSPLLDWTDSFNFENYHLELRQDSRTGAILADTTVTESQFKSPALARGKTYFWRVQACNELGCSVWSRWRTFMVAAQ